MYEAYYGLSSTPFRLTPDPLFFYEGISHKRGLAFLRYAFLQQEGFVVITGAPGTGKTELMLNLINELPADKVKLAKIVTSSLTADDLLSLVAAKFLPNHPVTSKSALLKHLEHFFITQVQKGKQVVLIIDEAHNLHVNSLIELAMLSNFQLREKPLLQCILLGQTQLEDKLEIPELAQLKQRVIVSTQLEPLSQNDTRAYIEHRLSVSGWQRDPEFTKMAHLYIYQYTDGIPRIINAVCSRILMEAYLHKKRIIDHMLCLKVINEIKEEIGESSLHGSNTTADKQLQKHFSVQVQPYPESKGTIRKPHNSGSTQHAAKRGGVDIGARVASSIKSQTDRKINKPGAASIPGGGGDSIVVEKISPIRKRKKTQSSPKRRRSSNLENILRPEFTASPRKKTIEPNQHENSSRTTSETGKKPNKSPAPAMHTQNTEANKNLPAQHDKYPGKTKEKVELALVPLQDSMALFDNAVVSMRTDDSQAPYRNTIINQLATQNGLNLSVTDEQTHKIERLTSHTSKERSSISGFGIAISVISLLAFWWYLYGPDTEVTLATIDSAISFAAEKIKYYSQ